MWHFEVWDTMYCCGGAPLDAIMTEKVMAAIAKSCLIAKVDDFTVLKLSWLLHLLYTADVLKILLRLDCEEMDEKIAIRNAVIKANDEKKLEEERRRAEEKVEKAAIKLAEQVAAKAVKEVEKEVKKAEKAVAKVVEGSGEGSREGSGEGGKVGSKVGSEVGNKGKPKEEEDSRRDISRPSKEEGESLQQKGKSGFRDCRHHFIIQGQCHYHWAVSMSTSTSHPSKEPATTLSLCKPSASSSAFTGYSKSHKPS
jgi:hypothetical protein